MTNERLKKYISISNKLIKDYFENESYSFMFPPLSDNEQKSIIKENVSKELAKKIKDHYDSDNDIYDFDEALDCLIYGHITNNYLKIN